MKCKFMLPVLLIGVSGVASADQMDSMRVASDLATVLAAEASCGLEYDQTAIEHFIEKKVSADDMGFPSSLSMLMRASGNNVEEMSASQKTAHCTQIKRVAKSYGFVK